MLKATVHSELDLYGTYRNSGGTIGAYDQSVVKLFDATIDGASSPPILTAV
jgi:hypothetical protein